MRFLTDDECAEWIVRRRYPVTITGRPTPQPTSPRTIDWQDSECPVDTLFADTGLTPYKTTGRRSLHAWPARPACSSSKC